MTAKSMVHFHPAAIDVREDPEYRAIAESAGLRPHLMWTIEEKATRAKQLEMLAIDEEMFGDWLRTMDALLVKDLTDAEFTAERMIRLRLWQKERKRRQWNLHYKYGATRRRRLVEKDATRALRLEQQLSEIRVELARRLAARAEGEKLQAPVRPLPPASKPATPKRPDPDPARENLLQMIIGDTGIPDPDTASDDALREAYANSMPAEAVEWYIDELRGRPHPEES